MTQAFLKTVEQIGQMDMHTRPAWGNLTEEQRTAWIQSVINFYPPNSVSEQEAIELARDEYNDAESLLPTQEICETD